jgi:uncharacterized protein
MRIIITGGSGLIGTALADSLLAAGNQVWILTRELQSGRSNNAITRIAWDGRTIAGWGEVVSQVDAVVNLACENIGSGPWTKSGKKRILSSRVEAGKAITEAIQQADPRPKVLIQASAVGFYGARGSELITEESTPGSGFLSEVCKAWEASTQPVEELGVRRIIIRTGVVLARGEGVLKRMMMPFYLFAGGPLGSGKQGLPWIHLRDEVAGICFLIENEKAYGVFNFSAPEPLSNDTFGRILAKEMRRPYWLPVPGFVLPFFLGEMSTLVLNGQYMVPRRLLGFGFRFIFNTAESALHDLLNGR